MKIFALALLLAGSASTPWLVTAPTAPPQEPDPVAGMNDMAAMIEKAKQFTEPGAEHELLGRMIGTWDTELRLFMGGQATPAEKGVAVMEWEIEGRWLRSKSTGSVMNRQMETLLLIGYDKFKMSYVMTMINSMDTAMIRAEGDVDPRTGALLAYGTLDEYLTGEHDKMVKYVFRSIGADEMLLEVHDLPIGETHTKVFEIAYTRRK